VLAEVVLVGDAGDGDVRAQEHHAPQRDTGGDDRDRESGERMADQDDVVAIAGTADRP
jgi:hypothetical protein